MGDAERTRFAHGSPPPELLVGTRVTIVSDVGNRNGVSVGRGVAVEISVGGSGVEVGMAA